MPTSCAPDVDASKARKWLYPADKSSITPHEFRVENNMIILLNRIQNLEQGLIEVAAHQYMHSGTFRSS